jgi:hypothetical protein
MDLTIALDGSKRRDLQLFQGDTVTITAVVYEHDGDADPLATVSGARFVDLDGAGFVYGTPFGVSENDVGRRWYRLVGEVDGVTTTLAFGYIIVEGSHEGWPCGCPCDGYWRSP